MKEIVNEHSKYYDTDKQKSEQIIREGLKKYPGNDILLNCLVGVIPIPERGEEVIELCKALIESTRHDEIKYDAYRLEYVSGGDSVSDGKVILEGTGYGQDLVYKLTFKTIRGGIR